MAERTDQEIEVANLLKGETYAGLIERLAQLGVDEKEVNVRNKLSRGKIHGGFLTSMPIRYWIAAVAFGLIGFVQSGQAQEEADNEQVEARQQEQPAQSYPLPFPIEIIEDQAESDARERREAEALQREIDDLIAQQGMNAATQAMNDATQRMALYNLISTVLVGVGTVLLIVTLYLTRQANMSAQKAVEVTREVGEAQTRAYLGVADVSADLQGNDEFGWRVQILIDIKNGGQTPAKNIDVAVVVRQLYAADTDLGCAKHEFLARDILPNDRPVTIFHEDFPIAEAIGRGEGDQRMPLFTIEGRVWYRPVVGSKRYRERFYYVVYPPIPHIGALKIVTRPKHG